ncbi:MAG TPA: MarR family transcriptional regulator [Nitrospirales bacterium]|nr:MarR family transcriptional regulator [Nitrospirales bacterium]
MRARAARSTFDPYESELGDVLGLMRLLWSVDHALQETSKRMASDLGITGPQRLVIRIVGHYPGISAGEVARILCVHPSTLTGVLRRLIKRGLLARAKHHADRRRAVLHLSDKGRRVNNVRVGTVEASVRRAVGRVSPLELAAGRRLLRTLQRELLRP